MAKIKYSEEQEPIKKKHFGFTFIKNSVNYSMFPAQRNKRTRTTRQLAKMQNLQKAVRFWRTMPGSVKEIWETFAATYPQPSKRVTGIPLTGYQLFIKRNHYCFLNAGLLSDFMELPELVSLPDGSPVFTLQAGLNTIDLTEFYIQNFGFIPSPGQWLIFAAVPYSEISGQFFPVIYQSIQVLETYIDGFFLNIEMPTIQPSIVYSIYLSKPVNPGQSHKSSKVRYMGCFTTKSFLGLSDTPSSYAGQAGKVATVNPEENGLIFSAGGGGLTCGDLPSCPTIIDIQADINDIYTIINFYINTSIPPVNFGLLYNWWAVTSVKNICPVGFRLMTYTEAQSLQTYLGGRYLAGGPLCENSMIWFDGVWATSTNITKLNFRGSGYRSYTGGFLSFRQQHYMHFPTDTGSLISQYSRVSPNVNEFYLATISQGKKYGYSLRPVKTATGIPDGTISQVTGNNGYKYRTITVNGLEILADNLAETRYQNGDLIPIVVANADWSALLTDACCPFNNVWSNV